MNAYQIKWSCFRFEGKKRIAKYVTKGVSALVIGNLVLVPFSDAAKIEKNIAGTRYSKPHRFEITDKQFALINITPVPYDAQMSIEDICKLKKCSIPHLLLKHNGCIALVPVTNLQFMGTDALQRKSIWI